MCRLSEAAFNVARMKLRLEHAGDRRAVRDIHLQAFGDEHGAAVADLTDDLRTLVVPGEGLSLVAQDGDHVIGHVMFTPALLDAPERLVGVRVLSPLGVLPDSQRRGVGAALVRRGLEIMRIRSVPLVFLEGEPGFYPRFGFEPAGQLGFRKPSLRIPDPAFQVVRLDAVEPWMTGTLVYPEIFWRHDAVGLRDGAVPA
ncbi:putative acetyltransferase [Haloactinopolyspora alba]|uniref:Putative acetyltransferase n=2 Tax=Haloactinopolyspora alba TaxID=648780 RepID=A0A2P8E3F0_9ACTN|nr:putative acetyltransferase [Haloactinopolyspora alba]